MDAEEKKLSRNTESGEYPGNTPRIKLHCFPDIAVDTPDDMRVCLPQADKFERTRYSDGSNCSVRHSDFDRDSGSPSVETSDNSVDTGTYAEGYRAGMEEGRKTGEAVGFERATQKLEPLLDSLQQGLLQLENLRRDNYDSIEKEVVELALAIARKVICREIKMDKDVVVCVAREALAKVDDSANITIKMNPDDLQFINETKYQLSDLIENIENVSLTAENNVPSGGCVIETDFGEIDARIENQLQAVEESFQSAIEHSGKKPLNHPNG